MLTTHTVEMCITTLTNHKEKIERKNNGQWQIGCNRVYLFIYGFFLLVWSHQHIESTLTFLGISPYLSTYSK
jgi:hypothetical protein